MLVCKPPRADQDFFLVGNSVPRTKKTKIPHSSARLINGARSSGMSTNAANRAMAVTTRAKCLERESSGIAHPSAKATPMRISPPGPVINVTSANATNALITAAADRPTSAQKRQSRACHHWRGGWRRCGRCRLACSRSRASMSASGRATNPARNSATTK